MKEGREEGRKEGRKKEGREEGRYKYSVKWKEGRKALFGQWASRLPAQTKY